MNKNLIKLLGSFTQKEWDEFEDFSCSPYFTKSRSYISFVKFLRKKITGKNAVTDFTPEEVNKHTGKDFSTQTIYNRLSELVKLAERFLSLKHYEKNHVSYHSGLFEELSDRGLHDILYSVYKSNSECLDPKDPNDFISYSKIVQALGFYYRSVSDFPAVMDRFFRQSEYIAAFSLEQFLYYKNELVLLDKLNLKFNSSDLKTLFNSVNFDKLALVYEKSGKDIYKPFLLKYCLLKMLSEPANPGHAEKAQKYFEENRSLFSTEIKSDYFIKMESHFVNLVNSGIESAYENLHEVHKERLADGETINFSLLNYFTSQFRDFVITGLAAGDFKWVEGFIEKYSSGLHTSIRNDEVTIARARLCAEKNDLLTAVYLLKKRKNTSFHLFNVDAYFLKIRIYFELKMYREMELEVDNLRHYMHKNDLVEKQVSNTKIFIEKLTHMLKIMNGGIPGGWADFRKDIKKNVDSIMVRRWFLKMIDNLDK